MKFLKSYLTATLFLSLTTIAFSQNENTDDSMNNESTEMVYTTENSVLENNTYTYDYNGKDVIVVFNNNQHTEYYNNKKHYIKSELVWKNKYECTMTIVDVNYPKVPFKPGTELDMKITKVKNDVVYYESTLRGRTWEGKMKLSDYNEHF